MHIVMSQSHSTTKVTAAIAFEVGDRVLVRFEPDESNLGQGEHFRDTESTKKSRWKANEHWIWYAGEVVKIYKSGNVLVEFDDGDERRLAPDPLDIRLIDDSKFRATLNTKRGGSYALPIPHGLAYKVTRKNDYVAEKRRVPTQIDDTGAWYNEMALDVKKIKPSNLKKSDYEKYTWVGVPLTVATPTAKDGVREQVKAAPIAFCTINGRQKLALFILEKPANVRRNWTTVDIVDGNVMDTIQKIDAMAKRSKYRSERMSFEEVKSARSKVGQIKL